MNRHVRVEEAGLADAEWQRLTSAANEIFAQDDKLAEALPLYREAFEEAERLFRCAEIAPDRTPATTIYVISCQNLAEAVRRCEGRAAARGWLIRAFERLVAAGQSPATPFALRLDCMRDLKFAFLNLVEQCGDDETFLREKPRLMQRGREVVASVTQLAQHIASVPQDLLRMRRTPGRPLS
ncbi:MAG: DUF2753 domain-containing protein [Beijerinckiaceae bacterium]|nr:DUF2753 domain-containing protein [Beijerinckiaceae bacterium]